MRIGYYLALPPERAKGRLIKERVFTEGLSSSFTSYGMPRFHWGVKPEAPCRLQELLNCRIVFLSEHLLCKPYLQMLMEVRGYPFLLLLNDDFDLPFGYEKYVYGKVDSNNLARGYYGTKSVSGSWCSIGDTEYRELYEAKGYIAAPGQNRGFTIIFSGIPQKYVKNSTLFLKSEFLEDLGPIPPLQDYGWRSDVVLQFKFDYKKTEKENGDDYKREIRRIFERIRTLRLPEHVNDDDWGN